MVKIISLLLKKKEFVVYIGSHGDKGAEIADLIIPGAAFTEQDGYFTNIEGKLQMAFKASYPPGEAKEDWFIINEISKLIDNNSLFKDKNELLSAMHNYLSFNKISQDQLKVIKTFQIEPPSYYNCVVAQTNC